MKQKEEALQALSEDEFRDRLIRPLFLKKGFKHGEEMCGSDEEGKDCYFTIIDQMGVEMVYAVQTKSGNLNMASNASKNLENAVTQMRMLMKTNVVDLKTKQKRKPNVGVLCASGKINQAARRHIQESVSETNIRFMDIDEIITDIDTLFPEFWLGVSANRNPYLISLHEDLSSAKDELSLVNILADLDVESPITEEGYANLRLSRTFMKVEKSHGKISQKPQFEEITGIDLLKRRKELLLVKGEGGFGKSTLLRRIAEIISQRTIAGYSELIPVLMRAKMVAGRSNSLAGYAFEATQRINRTVNAPGFSSVDLTDGNVIILIDALDELADDEQKATFTKMLKSFHESYPKCKIILTSRDNAFLRKCSFLATFEEWNVLPLELREAQKLIKLAAAKKVIPVERTAEVLRQLDKIHGIEINPLLVTILSATADVQRRDIPANITELFSKFVEIMLGRWDSKKGFSQQFESPLKHRLLADLALKMHSDRSTSISCIECENFLRGRLELLTDSSEKVEVLLDEIVNRSGLLRIAEAGIEFRHLLLQEYFAGSAIRKVSEIAPVLGEEWWRRVVVFYFGSNPDDGEGLLTAAVESELSSPEARFCAAVTIGLASQACYFVEIPARVDVLAWVCDALAKNMESSNGRTRFPLHDFLFGYLMGKDAMGSEIVKRLNERFSEGAEANEIKIFWVVAGLIEIGAVEAAWKTIKSRAIQDPKLLTALYLGLFTRSRVRFTDKETKKICDTACEYLDPFVASYRRELLKEFKTIVLEVRSGRLVEREEDEYDIS
jgi:energy-coupling factor transporter ATP-binding protein EcfA2